jgi:hypothetical protein
VALENGIPSCHLVRPYRPHDDDVRFAQVHDWSPPIHDLGPALLPRPRERQMA